MRCDNRKLAFEEEKDAPRTRAGHRLAAFPCRLVSHRHAARASRSDLLLPPRALFPPPPSLPVPLARRGGQAPSAAPPQGRGGRWEASSIKPQTLFADGPPDNSNTPFVPLLAVNDRPHPLESWTVYRLQEEDGQTSSGGKGKGTRPASSSKAASSNAKAVLTPLAAYAVENGNNTVKEIELGGSSAPHPYEKEVEFFTR